ncbi:hypothetical protein JNO54_00195 [Janibacter sp. YIM B02568]|jgi:heme/copper-type cytochrome/quinol oxidase subunit 2|uniref:hypothetical protein n=1 Tax=Janibacter TaxID=53457 RepID=UPI001951F031|nr:hypothetical protein [Janibacter endophyticus]MBM6544567.1 hypothetical protein [Janibacter endophyticus]
MKHYVTTITSVMLGMAALLYVTSLDARERLEARAKNDEGIMSIEAAIIAAVVILIAGLLVVKLTGAFESRSEGIE